MAYALFHYQAWTSTVQLSVPLLGLGLAVYTIEMNRKNSFDFIRLLAAVAVIFSHSFALTGSTEPGIGKVSIGAMGVWIFFILSGYLISKSWDQYPRFNVFFAKRLLRIIPGLAVAIISTILVAGLFFSSISLIEFFTRQETFSYLNNVLIYNPSYFLPGVFENNIYPLTVNGSIWTLAYEFTMYLAVALIGVFGIYKKIPPFYIWVTLLLLTLLAAIIGWDHLTVSIFYLNLGQMLIFALMFFSGIMMHKYEKIIKLTTRNGLLSFSLFIVCSLLLPIITPLFAAIFLAYAVFALGTHDAISWIAKYGDFSYGLYIYAFPIQQMIASVTNTTSMPKMFTLSLLLTFIVSVLSWYLIESKALKWKSKINIKKYPIIQSNQAW